MSHKHFGDHILDCMVSQDSVIVKVYKFIAESLTLEVTHKEYQGRVSLPHGFLDTCSKKVGPSTQSHLSDIKDDKN